MSNTLRPTLLIVFAALALGMFKLLLTQRKSRKPDPDTYYALRDQILHLTRDRIGLPAPQHDTDVWAVLMDWGVTHGTATVVAISDGTASIYLSSGGGSIGGGKSHDSLRKAALQAVSIAAKFQPEMRPVANYPLPRQGQVFSMYSLTPASSVPPLRRQS